MHILFDQAPWLDDLIHAHDFLDDHQVEHSVAIEIAACERWLALRACVKGMLPLHLNNGLLECDFAVIVVV